MKLKNAPRVIGAIAGVVVFSGLAAADPIVRAGQFNLAGTVYVTDTSFLFGYSAGPTATSADQTAGVLLPATGSFSDLKAGDIATMHNLLTPSNGAPFGPGPIAPGSAFLLPNFIQLPDGINVDLTAVKVNLNVPLCAGTAFDMPGGICRAQPGSPVVLEQGATGATALLNFEGLAHYSGSSAMSAVHGAFSANFAAPPDNTISGLLTDFATSGFITTGFQVNFSTSAPVASTPEPLNPMLLGVGLIGLGLWQKKRVRSLSN